MKRYLHLTCTICKRSIDKLVDLTHYSPDKCTITLGCEGRLQPVQYLSNGGIAVAPEIGLTDWRPRGSTVTTSTPTEPVLIDLSTGTLKQLVLAVPRDTVPAANSTYNLELNVKASTPKAFRQYIFRKDGTFNTVSGTESGLEKKALRFIAYGTNPDIVEVFVNGVKYERGTDPGDYQVYDGTADSPAAPNTILFNTAISYTSTTQVDIIISKQQASTAVTLTFNRNQLDESRVSLGAYENISYVDRLVDGEYRRYYLYTLDVDTAGILLNSILTASTNSDLLLLLARKPYTQLDRYLNMALQLSDMSVERDFIKYYVEEGMASIKATSTALSNIFPPLRVGKFSVEKTLKKATPGAEEQIVLDGAVIVGPDA